MSSKAQQANERYEAVKTKVWAVKGPKGQLHIQSEIQPLGSTLVTVVFVGKKDGGSEHLFTTWADVKAFVIQTITDSIEEGLI